jgi:hypothetical protein
VKIVVVMTRFPVVDTRKWLYSSKHYVYVTSYRHYWSNPFYHRVPSWMTLHAHLILEEKLSWLWNVFFNRFCYKPLLFPLDLILGVISARKMSEILAFWKVRH